MKRDISFLFASEIRLCSLLIGIIQIMWAFIGLNPLSTWLFSTRLHAAGLGIEWFGGMLLAGLVLVIGSIFPWRAGRHIGLFLSALVWFTMTGQFMDLVTVSPVALSMPVFGIFAIGLAYADARRKPREKLDT